MVCNVGTLDRVVRALFALVLMGAALIVTPINRHKIPLLIAGMLFFLSASFGVCFVYRMFGFSTAKTLKTPPNLEPDPK